MADPRLQWRQVNAPDLSAASAAIARGNASFNRGFEGGISLLDKYGAAQQEKADNELLTELASISDEAELDKFLGSGALDGRNISAGLRDTILNRRGDVLGYGQTRAATDSVLARTAIARAGEDRSSTLFNQDQQRQEYLRNNAGGFLSAERQALNNGSAFSSAIDATESGGGADQYDTLFGHRNRQNGVKVSGMNLGQLKEFSSTSGNYGQSVNREIGRVATPMGKYQIVGTTLRNIQNQLDLPDTVQFNPDVQELMGTYLGQQRVFGPRSQAAKRDGLRAEWEGFKNKSDAELDVIISELQSRPPVSREEIIAAGSGQPQQRGFGGDQFASQLAASGLFTPDQIINTVNPIRGAAQQGDARIFAEEQARITSLQDQAVVDAFSNPEISANNPQAIIDSTINRNDLAPADRLELLGRVTGTVEANPGIFNPEAPVDPLLEATLASEARLAARDIHSNPTSVIISREKDFRADPTGALIQYLDLFKDGESSSPKLFGLLGERQDRQTLDKYIREGAKRTGVAPASYASAMVETFERDPLWSNTNDRRFNTEKLDRFVRENLSTEAVRRYEDNLIQYDRKKGELEISQNNLADLQSQALRFESAGKPVPEKLINDINKIKTSLSSGTTPQATKQLLSEYVGSNGMADRLQGLDPESPDFFRAMIELEQFIEVDPSLTSTEKRLLIQEIRG